MGKLTKDKAGAGKTKWLRKLKKETRTLPKNKLAMGMKSRGLGNKGGNDEDLVEDLGESEEVDKSDHIATHLAPTFDVSADHNMEDYLMIQEDETDGKMRGERSGGAPGVGKTPSGQPATKGTGDAYIKLVREEEASEMKSLKSYEDAHSLLAESWGEEVELGEMGANHHGHQGGWSDINPVEQWEYTLAAHKLENAPDHNME